MVEKNKRGEETFNRREYKKVVYYDKVFVIE